MPNIVTLSDLRTRARQAADMVTGQLAAFCSDSEINGYLNRSGSDLHDILVARYADWLVRTPPPTFSLIANQEWYLLPDDWQATTALYYLNGTERRRLREYMPQELESLQSSGVILPYYSSAPVPRYRLVGNSIHFVPMPSSGVIIEHWYAPVFTQMANDSDQLEYPARISGWDEYVVVDAAIKMRRKGNLPLDGVMAAKAELKNNIIQVSQVRDAGEPQRVQDVYSLGLRRRY